jgi:hypothetical protein
VRSIADFHYLPNKQPFPYHSRFLLQQGSPGASALTSVLTSEVVIERPNTKLPHRNLRPSKTSQNGLVEGLDRGHTLKRRDSEDPVVGMSAKAEASRTETRSEQSIGLGNSDGAAEKLHDITVRVWDVRIGHCQHMPKVIRVLSAVCYPRLTCHKLHQAIAGSISIASASGPSTRCKPKRFNAMLIFLRSDAMTTMRIL